jgi:hypothetical protein
MAKKIFNTKKVRVENLFAKMHAKRIKIRALHFAAISQLEFARIQTHQ